MSITELKALAEKATPGPWFSDRHGRVWRRNPADLYENGGGVAGDKPLAAAYEGWSGDGMQGYPLAANADLIAAANPAAILELIAQLEDAQRVARYESDLCQQALDSRKEMESQLEDAQGENRALRATEAGLRERVKELEGVVEMALQIGDQCSRGFIGAFQKKARALLEKQQ